MKQLPLHLQQQHNLLRICRLALLVGRHNFFRRFLNANKNKYHTEIVKEVKKRRQWLEEEINKAKEIKGKPTAIILKTVKGKGISYMEDVAEWHGKSINDEDYEKAKMELGGNV